MQKKYWKKLAKTLAFACAAVLTVSNVPIAGLTPTIDVMAADTTDSTKTDWPVTITGNGETIYYDGNEHSVTGYTVGIMPEDTTITYSGSDTPTATGTDIGTYTADLNADDFTVSGTYANTYNYVITTKPITLEIKQSAYTTTYNANGSTFSDGASTTNVLKTQYLPTAQTTTKYSHTSNISDDGTQNSNYNNSEAVTDIVTIPGAPELTVTLTYGGENARYDWVCALEGSHSDYTATSNYSSAISVNGTQKFGGGSHTDAANTVTFTVPGDSVTFAFRSDSSGVGDGYGYYAVVTGTTTYSQTGTYEIPTVPSGKIMTGWNTKANGSGTTYHTGADVPTDEDLTVYAQYADPWYSDWTYTMGSGKITLTAYNGSETTYKVPAYTYSSDAKYTTVYGAGGSAVSVGTITDLSFKDGVVFPENAANLFYYQTGLVSLDLSNVDTSSTTSMSSMFGYDTALTSLDLTGLDTSKVTSMGSMFYNDTALTTLDLSSFDMSSVTSASSMLSNDTALTKIIAPAKATSEAITLPKMFYGVGSDDSADTDQPYTRLNLAPAKKTLITASNSITIDSTAWYSDWTYTEDDSNKIIKLAKYNSNDTKYKAPATITYNVKYMNVLGTSILYTEPVNKGADASALHTDRTWVTAQGGSTVADLSDITADTTVYSLPLVSFMSMDGTNTVETVSAAYGGSVSSSKYPSVTWVTTQGGSTVADLSSVTDDVTVYAKSSVTVKIKANVTLSGRTMTAGEFHFKAVDSDRTEYTATNDADGKVYFEIPITTAGSYTYTVSQTSPDKSTVTIPRTAYTVPLTVTENSSGTAFTIARSAA